MADALVVNLFGGPGVGKSSIACGVTCLLKMHGVNVEYSPEFAKDLTWEKRHETLQNQRYVWGKQHHRLFRLAKQVEVIVTDSPLPLSLVYGDVSLQFFHAAVLEAFSEFNNLNFLVTRFHEYKGEGRYQDEEGAKDVDRTMESVLRQYSIVYTTVKSTWSSVNLITIAILEELSGQRTELHTYFQGDVPDF